MNKTVLITGGARGLGRAIAEEFARHKYDIIITYLNSGNEALELSEYLNSMYGVDVRVEKLDVRNENDIKTFFLDIHRLDCLINNAAYNNDNDFFLHSKDDFMKTLEVNLVGPYFTSIYAYPQLSLNHGSIVNIASNNGINAMYPESAPYDASKAGLINLTKNTATQFAPNVRVNAVAPGWIETHNTEDMSLEFRGSELSKILLNRFAEPQEIAKLVYFLGSDDASYMTGSIVSIDGGVR